MKTLAKTIITMLSTEAAKEILFFVLELIVKRTVTTTDDKAVEILKEVLEAKKPAAAE